MSNLAKRILSAAVLIPGITALVVLATPPLFSLAGALLAGLSAWEYASMASRGHAGARRLVTVGLAVLVALSVSWSHRFWWAPLAAVLLAIPVLGACFMSLRAPPDASSAVFFRAFFGAIYTGALWGMVGLLHASSSHGPAWVLTLFGGVAMIDTGAYALGRRFGRRKLAPRISPKKTWAGAVGGLIGGFVGIAAVKLIIFSSLGWSAVLLLGAVLSPIAQFGDLLASYIKRGFAADDSGGLIPGHGGVLDLFDGLMLGAPVVVVFSALWTGASS